MTKEKEKVEKSDEQILFPEVKVTVKDMKGKEKEYVVKPWSFGDLMEVSPLIEEMFDQMEKRGTTIDDGIFDFKAIKNIYFSAISQVSKIVSHTVKVSEEELMKLSIDSIILLATAIWNSNSDSLKNVLSPFFGTGGAGLEEGQSEEQKDQS